MRTFEQEKQLLWDLRNEIVLGSLYVNDYECSYNIEARTVCDFFDGYVDFLEELAEEDGFEWNNAFDLYDAYDNADNLYNWFGCFEEDPLGLLSASEEDITASPEKAREALMTILDEDKSIRGRFYRSPQNHIYNRCIDEVFIVEDYTDADKIEQKLCARYFCFLSSKDKPGDGEMLTALCDWGTSDDYGVCSKCSCPIDFFDEQFEEIEDGVIVCFDCLGR